MRNIKLIYKYKVKCFLFTNIHHFKIHSYTLIKQQSVQHT